MHSSSALQVYLLDSPRIEHGAHSLGIPRLQTRALLYRLAVRLEPISRNHLCFLFWPDAPNSAARRNLTLLLSHLRRALPASNLLITAPEHVRLDAALVWSDSALFAQLYADSKNGGNIEDLKSAVSLYRAPLLSGFVPPQNCPEYDLWLTTEGQTFDRMVLEALLVLIETFAARGNTDEAIHYAQRYLEVDALAEDVHRRLMRLYALVGDVSAARRQFESCVAVLERELGVSPLPETHAVYEAILEGRRVAPPPAAPEHIWTTLAGPQVALVGRQQAWKALQHFSSQAIAERGGIVLLAGEAGIGKSRLMQEFAVQLAHQVYVLTGASHPGVQSIPYQPIIEALRPALREHAILAEFSESWLSVASLLFPEVRSLYPKLPVPALSEPELARGQIFEALSQLLLTLSRRSPVLLCLDDLHWADSTTQDWLSYVARYVRRSRLFILGTYRSEEADSLWALRTHLDRLHVLSEIHLEALGLDEVKQVLAHFYQPDVDLQRLAVRLQKITGGNSFFLIESVQALLETGVSPATFNFEAELPISASVRATIEQRMERLQPMARQLLEAGAVLGPTFDFEIVWQTAGRREMETVEGLDELVARRFFEEDGSRYRFHHELIQEVVYQTLSYWRRQLLHRRSGEVLEGLHPNLLDPMSGQIAEHFARGSLAARAIPFYQRAAEVAERVYATQEAVQHLMKALNLLKTLPDRSQHAELELDLCIVMAAALATLKGWSASEVGQTYLLALNLCARAGSAAQRIQVVWGLQTYHQVRAEFVQARKFAEEILKLAQDAGEAVLVAIACFHLGTVLIQSGEFVDALTYFQRTISLYDPNQYHPYVAHVRPDYGMFVRCFAAHALWHLGYPEQALTAADQALAIATELARPFDRVVALLYAATLHQFRREHQVTRELAQAAAQLCDEYEYTYYLAWATILLGWVQVETGASEKGIAQIRAGLSDFDKTGARIRKPYYLSLLAEAVGKTGQVEEGLTLLTQALALTSERGEGWPEAELLRLRGELLLTQDAAEEAERQFGQALELTRSRQSRSVELRATTSLCRLWQQQGKTTQAHTLLTEIYAWFTEGFDTPDLIQADSLLRTLAL